MNIIKEKGKKVRGSSRDINEREREREREKERERKRH
jgi:hypothetical protein